MRNILFLTFLFTIFSNSNAQIWTINIGKDEFGDSNGNLILGNENYFSGEFSNSITDGKLSVAIGITNKDIAFMFLEYGKYKVTFNNGYNFPIRLKLIDNSIIEIPVKEMGKNLLIIANKEDEERFISLIKKYSTIKCVYMDENKVYYSFTINCKGFTNAYNKAFPNGRQ